MSVAMDSSTRKTIYIRLMDEGTVVFRPTVGIQMADGQFCVQAVAGYDPDDEKWEFTPGMTVVCELRVLGGEKVLVAVKAA